eukprot:TRINITY_DN22995_c0_g1_i1.p1 TRINITY_DN22995_c0_g1~~TRINITY_DN22995_c0_g1_i1.p1  ORF type:complete len:646 (-),score=121.57 TRINITY_DN22995_c0_g1_i1:11-1714(-)
MAGSAGDWDLWVELLRARCPLWTLRPLHTLTEHARPVVGKSLCTLAALAADEVGAAVREVRWSQGLSADAPVTLHCVAHSMGGIVMRGALPIIFDAEPNVLAGVFLTLSTPHLGVQAGRGAPEGLWRNLSFLTGFLSQQLPQLAAQDCSAGGEALLVALAKPGGRFLKALGRFRRRLCIAMEHGDVVIPTASGALWPERTWPKPRLPAHQVAGWGFAACSSLHTGCSREALTAADCITGSGWQASADRTCNYPAQALEGLASLCWERAVVRLQAPSPNVHVFLIGKRCEQNSAEHLLSRACVSKLADALAEAAADSHFPEAASASSFFGISEADAPGSPAFAEDAAAAGKTAIPSTGDACAPATAEPAASFRENALLEPGWQWTLHACPRRHCEGKWVIATEESCNNVRFYAFDKADEAHAFFDSWRVSRILFDAQRTERRSAGANIPALSTIRRTFYSPVLNVDCGLKWVVATEEGPGNARFYPYLDESAALYAFNHFDALGCTSRVLLAPGSGPDSPHREVRRAGWNVGSFKTILHSFQRELGRNERHATMDGPRPGATGSVVVF